MTRFIDQVDRRKLGVMVDLVPWADDSEDLFRFTRTGRAMMRRVA